LIWVWVGVRVGVSVRVGWMCDLAAAFAHQPQVHLWSQAKPVQAPWQWYRTPAGTECSARTSTCRIHLSRLQRLRRGRYAGGYGGAPVVASPAMRHVEAFRKRRGKKSFSPMERCLRSAQAGAVSSCHGTSPAQHERVGYHACKSNDS